MNKERGIYMINNIIDNKKYIGQSKDLESRWRNHKSQLINNRHKNIHLQEAWNKYGEIMFTHETIETFSLDDSQKFKDTREIYWINHYDTLNKEYGYNLDSGGFKGVVRSTETLNKISKSQKGHPMSETNKLKRTGKNNSGARKVVCINTNKIFDAAIEGSKFYKIANGCIISNCRNKRESAGKDPITGETLLWMYYEDYIIKNKTIGWRENYIEQSNFNTRIAMIICTTTKEIFYTITKAAEKYNCNRGGISNCCKGKTLTSGKDLITGERLSWMYYEEYLKLETEVI